MNYIMELLKCAITDNVPSNPPQDINWESMYKLCKHNRILSTIYFGILKLPKAIQKQVKYIEKYAFEYKRNIILDANREYELNNLRNEFNKHDIDYIFLKGSVSKYLYPDTSMRVMGDIDIFYHKTTHNIDDIFTKNGFQIVKKDPKEIVYMKPPSNIIVEMQSQLIDEGYRNWSAYLSNPWKKYKKVENSNEYKMLNNDFYIYHILHMAKHFINGGIGLTHVLDVYMMIKSYTDLDYTYINKELEKLNLLKFSNNIQMLVMNWFENKPLSAYDCQTAELLRYYLFRSRAFGVATHKDINLTRQDGTKKISLRKKIFPDKKTMVNYYGNIVDRYPILIPLYWVHLNWTRIFVNGKNTKMRFQNMNRIPEKRIDLVLEIMKRCGL